MKKAILEAASEALGEEERKERTVYWWNTEVESMIEEKRQLYQKWLATQDGENRKLYARASREVKNALRKAKNEAWEQKCNEIDRNLGGTRTKRHGKL
jgi:formaldehyde-activating enzyme involved in methanogenesis